MGIVFKADCWKCHIVSRFIPKEGRLSKLCVYLLYDLINLRGHASLLTLVQATEPLIEVIKFDLLQLYNKILSRVSSFLSIRVYPEHCVDKSELKPAHTAYLNCGFSSLEPTSQKILFVFPTYSELREIPMPLSEVWITRGILLRITSLSRSPITSS